MSSAVSTPPTTSPSQKPSAENSARPWHSSCEESSVSPVTSREIQSQTLPEALSSRTLPAEISARSSPGSTHRELIFSPPQPIISPRELSPSSPTMCSTLASIVGKARQNSPTVHDVKPLSISPSPRPVVRSYRQLAIEKAPTGSHVWTSSSPRPPRTSPGVDKAIKNTIEKTRIGSPFLASFAANPPATRSSSPVFARK